MPTATIQDIAINYELYGDRGDPLVLVHGYTGDSSDWRFQIEDFSPTHRVLVMDLRGHGASAAPADRDAYTVEQMANDIEELIDMAGFTRYHLVGHSMGGMITQEIALRSPGRLSTLTLEDTGHTLAADENDELSKYTAKRVQIALEEGMEALANRPPRIPPPPFMPAERMAEERERLARMPVDGFIGAAAGIRSWCGTRDRLGRIKTPTLVICGELDVFLKPSRQMASLIPDAKLEIIPQAGHSPQYERPGLFNRALREHLEKHAEAGSA